MQNQRTFLLLIGIAFLMTTIGCRGCLEVQNRYTKVAPGKWRGVLKLVNIPITPNPAGEPIPEKVNLKFDEVTDGELPFDFEIIYTSDSSFYIEIINGKERIKLEDIAFGRGKERAMDTIQINFPIYNSYINAWVEGPIIEGFFHDPDRGQYKVPFVAYHGKDYRFTALSKEPIMDVSGKWAVTFGTNTEEPYKAIGEFEQNGNHLIGTFRTETGDYRYLEGAVQADKLYLSTFDGAHAFLFEAKIRENGTMIGSFRSGKHYQTIWKATKNDNATLTSADSLTYLKEGYDRFEFEFDNPDGQAISLSDEAYQGKVKIVQILGTWCPNCKDETEFLVNYLKEKNYDDLAVVGLAFEKGKDDTAADDAIRRYKEYFNIPYEIVHAGSYKKAEAARALPMLNEVVSYPTLVFIDKNDQIRRIHTGFEGPATSQYQVFQKDFNAFVTKLRKE